METPESSPGQDSPEGSNRPELEIFELQVKRQELRETRIVSRQVADLKPGEALLEVDKFALTANNVSYAVAGEQIGYWKFFPPSADGSTTVSPGAPEANSDWGVIPVWGVGAVVQSACPEVSVGERLYGYFPMATHVVLQPGQVKKHSLADAASHRAELPPVYNRYSRLGAESPELQAMEDERCLFFPLFITSYFLYDYLRDNDYFGADQVLLGSASSKTAFGLAHLLHHNPEGSPEDRRRVVGLTSPANVDFVKSLGTYDQVVTYEEIEAEVEPSSSAFVDMAGALAITGTIHQHLGGHLKESCRVGATHWEAGRESEAPLPGPKPRFFFAPGQIIKREEDWGPGVAMRKANEASAGIAREALSHLTVSRQRGPEAVNAALRALFDNDVSPTHPLLLCMNR